LAGMNEASYIGEAKTYLLAFPGVTEEMLNLHLYYWRGKKPKDMRALFYAFLNHAKNRQGMPNSIGEIDRLSKVLFNFDVYQTANKYSSWNDIFDSIQASNYRPPGRMDKENNKNYWVIYCKAIASISKFLSSYKGIEDFNAFVGNFLTNTNANTRLALPLLLQEEIFGFGFALACDFLKENGYPDFVKPDTHINFIAQNLGITKETSDYHIFKDVISYCQRINAIPYEVDKLFWLVGSGDFYLSKFQVKSSKVNFVKQVLAKK
jgi:hypothetical protein